MLNKQSIGFVVIDDRGRTVKTGPSWGNKIAKVYSKVGPAKAIANSRGGSVYEAFIDIGAQPVHVAPIKPKSTPQAKAPYGD